MLRLGVIRQATPGSTTRARRQRVLSAINVRHGPAGRPGPVDWSHGTACAHTVNIDLLEIALLFDAVPGTLFFAKDRDRRYTHVNATIVNRLGLKSRQDVIGRRAEDVYPGGLGAAYADQDKRVLAGESIDNLLELQLFPNREPGWCVTYKRPWLVNARIVGLVGISRDLAFGQGYARDDTYERVGRALNFMNRHYAEGIRVSTLTDITGLSASRLERRFRQMFQLTPQQVLVRLRVQMAMHALKGLDNIATISYKCGFSDQSALARHFKSIVGVTPREYRSRVRLLTQSSERAGFGEEPGDLRQDFRGNLP